jgi:4-hydroxy-tetrahydrodipicolinate reductase
MPKLNVAVAGSAGRMGRALIKAVLADDGLKLAAALEQTGNPNLGRDAGEFNGLPCGVAISDDIEGGIARSDVLIDFTRPEGALNHVAACLRHGIKIVVGTTGFSDAQKKAIADAARSIALVFAPNMSVGTNLVFKLADIAARVLNKDYDVEIIEAHHRHKTDAPSGTALHLGEIIANALGRNLKECAVYSREDTTGERAATAIGFSIIRGGDIVGEHTVMFAGTGERVELTVRSASRATYAQGALRAAHYLAGKKSGLFDMQDVLGLR